MHSLGCRKRTRAATSPRAVGEQRLVGLGRWGPCQLAWLVPIKNAPPHLGARRVLLLCLWGVYMHSPGVRHQVFPNMCGCSPTLAPPHTSSLSPYRAVPSCCEHAPVFPPPLLLKPQMARPRVLGRDQLLQQVLETPILFSFQAYVSETPLVSAMPPQASGNPAPRAQSCCCLLRPSPLCIANAPITLTSEHGKMNET